MKQSTVLLIDGNSIGHANHNMTKLTVGGAEVQAIFGFLKSIRAMHDRFHNIVPIVLWDGRAQWRYNLFPGYKSGRQEARDKDPKKQQDKDNYEKQVPLIRKAMSSLGVRQVLHPDYEADDLAGLLVKKMPGRKIILVTGDQDWLTLIGPDVTWFDPIRDNTVALANLFEFSGYMSPRAFLQGKALRGDSSDSISGVGGIGEKGARELLARFGSVEKFWQHCEDGGDPGNKAQTALWKGRSVFDKEQWTAAFRGDPADAKALKKHVDAWEGQGRLLFERNVQLMDLTNVPEPDSGTIKIDKGEFNADVFQSLCERLSFQSILRGWQHFILPFASK